MLIYFLWGCRITVVGLSYHGSRVTALQEIIVAISSAHQNGHSNLCDG